IYNIETIKDFVEPKAYKSNLEDNIRYIQEYNALQIFRDLNAPAFIYDSDYDRKIINNYSYNHRNPKFFVNPLLKDYEFYKVFDTYQAFQEIQMFIGGVLGNKEKEIIEVADKYKIAKHGFDKFSFRKDKEVKNK